MMALDDTSKDLRREFIWVLGIIERTMCKNRVLGFLNLEAYKITEIFAYFKHPCPLKNDKNFAKLLIKTAFLSSEGPKHALTTIMVT
ncbi:hypothetical protein BpHYR1_040864 [Brachionus plicatilis]|uniref:Uncharacterized protein n=1 Tax=Brachionus plicatilis TaxID=10195 RepID=A0A3M7PM06_BRAPC|nr:hypothetical protein BpHYR1_040864 [Brachionus plicatilis]